ncbi:metallophosphoesterase family protein [Corynebacterium sp. ES2715-CONJ3]|uniref:purple acid phosphatase family protein n=1 Tax=Corynebacterium sp. ES2715-CONJ3 TaxID=2974028 RepID=UPI00216A1CBA|nr:metallophosphoesterase family protein [Corynebacterium sp. ES2715-CONJ3]MCS4492501.1 metallophosphoesterase family protein [Corynebacterium sp. ES2715-CONJ3]
MRTRLFTATLTSFALSSSLLTPVQAAPAPEVSSLVLLPGTNASSARLSFQHGETGRIQVQWDKASNLYNGYFRPSAAYGDAQKKLLGAQSYFTFEGLQPDTRYAYRIGFGATKWTEVRYFTTGSADQFNALVFGDVKIGARDIDVDRTKWQQALARAEGFAENATTLLTLGNQVNNPNYARTRYPAFLDNSVMPRLQTAPLADDTSSPNTDFDYYFSLPHESFNGVGRSTRNYYFSAGPALYIGLNLSNQPLTGNDWATLKGWLRQTVTAHGFGHEWIIIGLQRPPYSAATSDTRVRAELGPLFEELNVDLVLSGGADIYTRTHLLKGAEVVPPAPGFAPRPGQTLRVAKNAEPGEANEVIYVTLNSPTGANFAQPKGSEEFVAISNQDSTPDFSHLEVDSQTLTLSTYNSADASLVDAFTLDRRPESEPEDKNEDDGRGEKPGAQTSSTSSIIGIILSVLSGLGLIGGIIAFIQRNPQLLRF